MAKEYNFIEYTKETAEAIRKARDLPPRGNGIAPWPEHNRQQLLPPMMSDAEDQPGHPFDAEIINKGTEESPLYYVKIFNSGFPDSPYAGIVYVGDWAVSIESAEVPVTTADGFFVDLNVTYTGTGTIPFTSGFSLREYGTQPEGSETEFATTIAEGKLPNVASRQMTDISIERRWV